jgi:DNA-binding GntR family transcriptional regulator
MKEKLRVDDYSLSRFIAEEIAEHIIKGELKPGEKVVEAYYAEKYGLSRSPIREALYLLIIDGLVERIPRKGSIVKGYTRQDMYDLFEVRIMLENLASQRIAKIGVDKHLLKKMEGLVESMSKSEEGKSYAFLNQKFHTCLIDMCKSDVIKNMYSRLGIPLLSFQNLSFIEEENIKRSIDEHEQIFFHLKNNNLDELIRNLTDHNEAFKKRVEDILQVKK